MGVVREGEERWGDGDGGGGEGEGGESFLTIGQTTGNLGVEVRGGYMFHKHHFNDLPV